MAIQIYVGTTVSEDPDFEGFTPQTLELEASDYIVAVADFENNIFQKSGMTAHRTESEK